MRYQYQERCVKKMMQTGFTLIELLVAMLISLVLVFACTSLYSSLKSSILIAQDLEKAQESLRTSFYLMSRSVRQAASVDVVNGGANLEVVYDTALAGTPIYSCLGNSVSAITETYRSDGSDLYCNDGTGEQLVALGVTALEFTEIAGTNGKGITVNIKINGMPATYSAGIEFALALRQKILLDL